MAVIYLVLGMLIVCIGLALLTPPIFLPLVETTVIDAISFLVMEVAGPVLLVAFFAITLWLPSVAY